MPGEVEEAVASSALLAQCCFTSWMGCLCSFRLTGFQQGAQEHGLLLPGFACGWRQMSRLVEDIWWVQSSGAVTCGYGDCHSPGGVCWADRQPGHHYCCWWGATATPPSTDKFNCHTGNQGTVKLSSLAGNSWVATLEVDHINVAA